MGWLLRVLLLSLTGWQFLFYLLGMIGLCRARVILTGEEGRRVRFLLLASLATYST